MTKEQSNSFRNLLDNRVQQGMALRINFKNKKMVGEIKRSTASCGLSLRLRNLVEK
jgi:hypothetical protein